MPAPISFESQKRRESFHPGSFHMLSGSLGGAGFSFNSALKASLPYMPATGNNDGDHDMLDDFDSYHQPLEVDFCKDFSCCGLVLEDLHDLLQHYEEQHVRADDDTSSAFGSSPVSASSFSTGGGALHPQSVVSATPTASTTGRVRPDIDALKRKALADMHFHLGQPLPHDIESASPSSSSAVDDTDSVVETQFEGLANPRKRAFRPSMTSSVQPSMDFFTPVHSPGSTPEASMPATPVMHLQHDFAAETDNPVLYAFPSVTDDWFAQGDASMSHFKRMRQAITSQPMLASPTGSAVSTIDSLSHGVPQVIEHPGSSLVVVDKPFKCPVRGCDKAYKNQNGLKYHKAHGNCASDPAVIAAAQGGDAALALAPHLENKPYSCNVCHKRYKNLNGLKYHAAHSHQNVTVDSIQNQMFHQSQSSGVW